VKSEAIVFRSQRCAGCASLRRCHDVTNGTGSRSSGGVLTTSCFPYPEACTTPSSSVAIISERIMSAGTAYMCGRVSARRRLRPSLASAGTVFAFRSKRTDRLKLLFFDGTGVVLVAKRLEAGAFRWPKPGDAAIRLTAAEMAALVDGLDWRRVHQPRDIVVPMLAG